MDRTMTPREIEVRDEIADLNGRVSCGVPEHLDALRSKLSSELVKLVAARLTSNRPTQSKDTAT